MAKHVPARLPPMGVPVEVDRRPAASDDVQNVVGSVSSSDQSSHEVSVVSESVMSAEQSPLEAGVVRETVVEEEIKRRTTTREYIGDLPRLKYSPAHGGYPEHRSRPIDAHELHVSPHKPITAPARALPIRYTKDRDKEADSNVLGQPGSEKKLPRVMLPRVIAGVMLVLTVVLGRLVRDDSAIMMAVILVVGCVGAAFLIARSYWAERQW